MVKESFVFNAYKIVWQPNTFGHLNDLSNFVGSNGDHNGQGAFRCYCISKCLTDKYF